MKSLLPIACLAVILAAVLLTRSEPIRQELGPNRTAGADVSTGGSEIAAAGGGIGPRGSEATSAEVPPASSAGARQPVSDPDSAADLPVLVYGRILDPGGGPAAGAKVFARTGGWYSIVPIELDVRDGPRPAGGEAICDGSGQFAIYAGLEPGNDLALSVAHAGCAIERRLRLAFPHAPLDLGTIRLRAGLSLVGRLTDEGGKPVAGAEVLLGVRRGVAGSEGTYPGQGSVVGISDRLGNFRIASLAPGPWLLLFEAPGLCVAEREGVLAPGGSGDLGDVVLARGHAVAGTLRGVPADRQASLRIEARSETLDSSSMRRGRRTRLAADGTFRIEGIHPADRIRVRVLEQTPQGAWSPVAEVPQPIVPSGTLDIALVWGPTLTLTASVVDALGAPVEHFQAFTDLGYFGGTHEIGSKEPGEPAGHHPGGRLEASGMRLYSEESTPRLLIRAAGFEDFSRQVDGLIPGKQVDLGTLTLKPAARLVVLVQGPDGDPVEGAELELKTPGHRDQRAVTDRGGGATLNASPEAPQLLVARHAQWSTARQTIASSAGATTQVVVAMQRGCSLTVRVSDTEGAALTGHPVEVAPLLPSLERDPDARPSLRHTDPAGEVRWAQLAPGTYRVQRRVAPRIGGGATGTEGGPVVVELTPERPRTVQLLAAPECDVVGVVRDRRGPLSAATLRLGPLEKQEGWRTRYNRVSSSFGEFRFARIPHGSYTLQIEHGSRAMLATVPLVVPPAEQPVVIELPLASVRLRVLGPAGQPQQGATVELTTGQPGQSNPNRAWTDARRAWTDERGDLQQAWHQDPIHLRSTGSDGWVRFDGCLPGTEFHLRLQGPWLVASGPSDLLMLAAGEDRSISEPMIAFPAGAIEIHPAGNSGSPWKAEWNGPEGLEPELRFRAGELGDGPLLLGGCVAGPGELYLLRRSDDGDWVAAAKLDIDMPHATTLAVEADLAAFELRLR